MRNKKKKKREKEKKKEKEEKKEDIKKGKKEKNINECQLPSPRLTWVRERQSMLALPR